MVDERTARTRLRFRRILWILLILGLLGEATRRSSPMIHREWGIRLARWAIEADRLEDAEARLDALISENPRETRPRLVLVEVYRREGRITEAEEALQRAVELGASMIEACREHQLLQQLIAQPAAKTLAGGPS
jgi:Tfp pilus assembly protein PilF